jgi:hypothetical protein
MDTGPKWLKLSEFWERINVYTPGGKIRPGSAQREETHMAPSPVAVDTVMFGEQTPTGIAEHDAVRLRFTLPGYSIDLRLTPAEAMKTAEEMAVAAGTVIRHQVNDDGKQLNMIERLFRLVSPTTPAHRREDI